jgi:uncharacterized protein
VGLIYLDSCLLIYAIERVPLLGEKVLAAIAEDEHAEFAISPLVKLECLVKPIRAADLVLQSYYERALARLRLLELSDAVFAQATHLRARFGIKTPDALHLACAQHYQCSALWTNDNRLAQAGLGLVRVVI